MSLMSMTGRGAGSASGRLARVEVELSSVNRKQLDVAVGLPRALAPLEAAVQRRIRQTISRGRITGDVRVTWSAQAQAAAVRVDTDLAKAQIAALRTAARRLDLPDDLTASALLALPDVILSGQPSADIAALAPLVDKALGAALARLQAMRRKEGLALARDLRARLKTLEGLTDRIGARAPAVAAAYREGLLRRIDAALPEADPAGDERIAREVALFADRSDITEERVRLRSHLAQARGLLAGNGAAGRTLDFLVQEMGREINTIGAKANDAALTRHVIAFKTELERIREQAQNIE